MLSDVVVASVEELVVPERSTLVPVVMPDELRESPVETPVATGVDEIGVEAAGCDEVIGCDASGEDCKGGAC